MTLKTTSCSNFKTKLSMWEASYRVNTSVFYAGSVRKFYGIHEMNNFYNITIIKRSKKTRQYGGINYFTRQK